MKQPYAAVIGGINLDICGRSAKKLIPEDSNPGTVTMSPGGVGRNIAHNLRLLGVETAFVTALGGDLWSRQAERDCLALGMNLDYAVQVPEGTISIYLFLTEPDGNMALALSDTEIAKAVTPEVLEARKEMLCGAGAVVLDANLSQASILWVAEHVTAPLFVDPVSVSKAEKLLPVLGKLHTLKPNRMEAELLSGVSITDEESLYRAADALLATGLHRVFISLGGDGVCAADRTGGQLRLPVLPADMVNTTGCGDAFMAAITWAYLQGTDLEGTARAGLAASAIAMEGGETINPTLSETALKARSEL